MKDKGVLIGIIIALIYIIIIAGVIIHAMDKRVKYYSEEYKKANSLVLEYIEENKRLKNEVKNENW